MLKPSVLFVSALCALAASGCATKRVQMKPSAAIVQARANALASRTHPAPLCATVTLTAETPVNVSFGYEKAEVSEAGADALDKVADWLICHPANFAAIGGEPDPTGTEDHKKQLVAARVQAVKAYLATRGVATGRLLDSRPKGGAGMLLINASGRGW